jgi:hypothetical protein
MFKIYSMNKMSQMKIKEDLFFICYFWNFLYIKNKTTTKTTIAFYSFRIHYSLNKF